jgi:microcystin degradation protein MlrC
VRILVAGFQHETNTFAERRADWAAFERGEFFPKFASGQGFLKAGHHVGLPIWGFAQAAVAAGDQLVESCWAGAAPSGPLAAQAFDRVLERIVDDARAAAVDEPLDAVYLDLHGAAVSDGHDAPEVALLTALRRVIGSTTPLVVSLDSHANIDSRLLSLVDFATAYRTYPHIDMVETGSRTYRLLAQRFSEGSRRPVCFERIPFLIPILSQSTLQEPARGVYRLLESLEHDLGCDASFATGFPASDVLHCGPTVWAYGGNAAVAVERLRTAIVSARPAWRVSVPPAPDAVDEAMRLAEMAGGPVVIADPQDNPGAGTSGGTTGLLRSLLGARAGLRWPGRVAIGLLNDSRAARAAAAAGVGATVDMTVGESVSTPSGSRSQPPVAGRFKVRSICNAPVVLTGPMMTGTVIHIEPAAALEFEGIVVCVCSASTQVVDRSLFRALGVEPDSMAIVALKGAVHFRADFEMSAFRILLAKSPGEMASDPADLPWTRLRKSVDPVC